MTWNHKFTPPRPVKLLLLAPQDINFEEALGHIRTTIIPRRSVAPVGRSTEDFCLLPKQAQTPDLLTAEYQREIGTVRDELLDPAPAFHQCPFLHDALLTGGKNHDQGLWMLTGLATTFMRKGRELFHTLSKGHADYNEANVDAMFDRKETEKDEKELGWPSCQTFENYGSKQCKDCPLKGTIKSPLNLHGSVAQPGRAAASNSADLGSNPGTSATDGMDLPAGYYLNEGGYIETIIDKPGAKGVMIPVHTVLFNCKITEPWTQRGEKGLNFTCSVDKGHTVPVVIGSADYASPATMCTSLAKQQVKVNQKVDSRELVIFMSAWITNLHNLKAARDAVAYGWYKENGEVVGWAYGGIIRKSDGETLQSAPGDPGTRVNYTPRGKIEIWFEALKLVTDQHRPAIEVIAAAAFASPLLHFTGHYSGALIAYSQSGGNKSTALNVGAAVWGNPKLTKEVASASNNSVRGKMAELNNLPCYWDDVSTPKAIERAAEALVDITQGKDGGKMKADRSQQTVGSWQSMMAICSNKSMFDYMAANNHSDAAGIYRTFEYIVERAAEDGPGRIEEIDATYLQQKLEENYGRMGEKFSAGCLSQPAAMKKMVDDVHALIKKEVEAQEPERFWLAIVTTIITGARLANVLGASFNVDEIHAFLVKSYRDMRARVDSEGVIGDREDNIEAVLAQFLKETTDNTIRTKDQIRGRGGRGKQVRYVAGPDHTRNRPIHVQFVLEDKLLRLSRLHFTDFLIRTKHSPSMVLAGLKKFYNMAEGKANLCAGTLHQGGQERLLEIPVPDDHWLNEVANAFTPAPVTTAKDKFTVIQPDLPDKSLETPAGGPTPRLETRNP